MFTIPFSLALSNRLLQSAGSKLMSGQNPLVGGIVLMSYTCTLIIVKFSLNMLNHLDEEVEIIELREPEHEIAFPKRLLSWAKLLKRITITFNNSVSERMSNELRQILRSFSQGQKYAWNLARILTYLRLWVRKKAKTVGYRFIFKGWTLFL